MNILSNTSEIPVKYPLIAWRLAIIALKLLCVYALSQEDATFFYQQF